MKTWRSYYGKLSSEEFPWDKDTLSMADVTTGPREEITIAEALAAIKK